ncbi:hypothetical protein Hanom_Chr05g00434331 [Helianthus anomalus]
MSDVNLGIWIFPLDHYSECRAGIILLVIEKRKKVNVWVMPILFSLLRLVLSWVFIDEIVPISWVTG